MEESKTKPTDASVDDYILLAPASSSELTATS